MFKKLIISSAVLAGAFFGVSGITGAATEAVFNQYGPGVANYGDESDFLNVAPTGSNNFDNSEAICNGEEGVLRVYIHNGSPAENNATGVGIASNTAVTLADSAGGAAATNHTISATVGANTSTGGYTSATDTVNINCANPVTLSVSEAQMYTSDGTFVPQTGFGFGNTTAVSNDGNQTGVWPGCWEYIGWVYIKFTATEVEPEPYVPSADLSLKKKVQTQDAQDEEAPVKVETGDVVTYEIIVTNNGPDPAVNVIVTDGLPAGVTMIGTPNFNLGTIQPGASETVTFQATVTGTDGDPIRNNATVKSDTSDPSDDNNEDEANIVVDNPVYVPSADLSLKKKVQTQDAQDEEAPVKVETGDVVTYEIIVTNNGPDPAVNVIVTDGLPAGVTMIGTPNFNLGTIQPGASETVTFQATVTGTDGDPIRNNATVKSDTSDPSDDNNEDEANIVVDNPEVVVSIECTGLEMIELDNGDFKITITGTATNANITGYTLVINDGTSDETVNLAPSSDDSGMAMYTWTGRDITKTYVIKGTVVTDAGVAPFEAICDPELNAPAEIAQVSIKKSVEDNDAQTAGEAVSVSMGDEVAYKIAVTANAGNTMDATEVVVSDNLPTGLTFVSADNNYDENSGTWTIDSVAPGETVILTIKATVDTIGNHNNVATIDNFDQIDLDDTSDNTDPANVLAEGENVCTGIELVVIDEQDGKKTVTFVITVNNSNDVTNINYVVTNTETGAEETVVINYGQKVTKMFTAGKYTVDATISYDNGGNDTTTCSDTLVVDEPKVLGKKTPTPKRTIPTTVKELPNTGAAVAGLFSLSAFGASAKTLYSSRRSLRETLLNR